MAPGQVEVRVEASAAERRAWARRADRNDEVRTARSERGVSIEVVRGGRVAGGLRVDTASWSFEGGGATAPFWALSSELGSAETDPDVWSGLVKLAAGSLGRPGEAQEHSGALDDTDRLYAAEVAQLIAAELRWVWDRLEPGARRVAMKLPPEHRLAGYRRLATDPSRRLRQLLHALPGAFLLGLGLEAAGEEGARLADELFAGVVAGRRAHALARAAVEAWARLQGLPEEQAGKMLRLVRRAGPFVAPELLLRPLACAYVLEDLPRDPERNARWFELMHRVAGIVRFRAEHEAVAQQASRWLSKHGLGYGSDERELIELWHWVLRSKRCLARATSVAALREELAEDAERVAWRQAMLRAEAPGLPDAVETSLLPGWTWIATRITPILTREALYEEGRVMHHCVGSFWEAVASGVLSVFHVTAGPDEATIAIERAENGELRVFDFAAAGNSKPGPTAYGSVYAWLGEHGFPLHTFPAPRQPVPPPEGPSALIPF